MANRQRVARAFASVLAAVCAGSRAAPARAAGATGHGPLWGLATPTNALGAWSIDIGWMGIAGAGATTSMARVIAAYGVTPDFQLSLSGPLYRNAAGMPGTQGLAMMPMTGEIQFMAADRFVHRDTAVGKRREDTAYLALSAPNDGVTRPGLFGAVAHGDISRSTYLWEGVGYKLYGSGGTHPGDELFYSLVLGYRPRSWQTEFPKADFRLLLELVGEAQQNASVAGSIRPVSGGRRLFVGPGVLGTYESWGFAAGVSLPVLQDTNAGRRQSLRFAVDVTRFF